MPRSRETKARDSVVSTVVTVTVAPPNSNSYGVTGYIKTYDDTGIEIVSTPGHPLKMATAKDGATSQEQLPVSSMFIPTSTIEIVTH